MQPSASRPRVAWGLAVLTIACLLAAGTIMLVAIWPPARSANWGFTGFGGLIGAAFGSMGAAITFRRPDNRVGRILMLAAMVTALQFVIDLVPLLVVHNGGAGTASETWASWLSNGSWIPPVTLLGYLLLIYPDGRLPGPRWSVVRALLGLAALATFLAAQLSPGGLYNYPNIQNPIGIAALPATTLMTFVYLFYMTMQGAAALSLVVRWRQAGPLVRAQLKWLALVGIPFVVATTFSIVSREAQYVAIGFGGLIPAGIAMAILRDRLYEIDRIISRTIGWAIVSAALAAAFVVLVLLLQAALSGVTQGQTLAVAASTLTAFALFQPLRRRIQRAVDRRFDRSRYDAQQMVEGFAGRLRSEVDLPAVRVNLVMTTANAVHPLTVAVWVRSVEGHRLDVSSPDVGLDRHAARAVEAP